MMWGGMFFMWFFWMAIIIAAVFLIAYIVNPRHVGCSQDAIKILQGRFARGELNREEYEERRKILMNS